MAPRNYGSLEEEDPQAGLALMPNDDSYIGTVDGGGECDEDEDKGAADAAGGTARSWLARQHCVSYALTAAVCLLAARYWDRRAGSYHSGGSSPARGGGASRRRHRVPNPPAFSSLDPAADLNFRTISRHGLASPSRAWGEYLNDRGDEDGGFTPLPTNAWYNNLLSHRAASDPAGAGEVAHVYTVPYVIGVSPPRPPRFPSPEPHDRAETMAGIDILLPYMKTSSSNVQMVFLKFNGVSLGAIVEGSRGDDAPTSYVVDSDEELSPLGVSLKWNHVAMRTSIVRGMPYGTMRYGRDPRGKSVLPVITAGSRVKSIHIDGDGAGGSPEEMLCGSLSGEAVEQDPNRRAAITSDGKAETYDVKREIIFQLSQSDFTWVAVSGPAGGRRVIPPRVASPTTTLLSRSFSPSLSRCSASPTLFPRSARPVQIRGSSFASM